MCVVGFFVGGVLVLGVSYGLSSGCLWSLIIGCCWPAGLRWWAVDASLCEITAKRAQDFSCLVDGP